MPMTTMETGTPGPEERVSAAPGPALLLTALAVLLAPLLLAALWPRLPGLARGYLAALPLPLVEIECAAVLALFVLPLFRTPSPEQVNPVVLGLVRGLFLGAAALPLAVVARAVCPVPAGAVLAGCLLAAVLGAGAVAASAAFGAGGLAAAILAAGLPGMAGFFGQAAGLPLGWLGTLSPFEAIEALGGGGSAWALGLLPGMGLLLAGLLRRPVRSA